MVNNTRSSNSGTPRFALSELNQDIAKVVGEMKPGEISKPFYDQRQGTASCGHREDYRTQRGP